MSSQVCKLSKYCISSILHTNTYTYAYTPRFAKAKYGVLISVFLAHLYMMFILIILLWPAWHLRCHMDSRANLACSLKWTRTPIGTTLQMTQTAGLSKVGILSPTSPSADSKVTILIIVFSPHLKTSCMAKNKLMTTLERNFSLMIKFLSLWLCN